MLFTGISPRTTFILKGLGRLRLFISKLTTEPFFPFNCFISSCCSIPTRLIVSAFVILSPAIIPAFSEGPPSIACITYTVSLGIVKLMPIPEKLPFRSSLASSALSCEMYEEWGSSSERILGIDCSTSEFIFTVSTY